MLAATDIVIFGIKAGLRLAQQGRQAYVEAAINRSLILPLPNFNPDPTVGAADGYFHGQGRHCLQDHPNQLDLTKLCKYHH